MEMEGIRHIGDGLLEVGEERLKEFLVEGSINDLYDVEQTPFARYVHAAASHCSRPLSHSIGRSTLSARVFVRVLIISSWGLSSSRVSLAGWVAMRRNSVNIAITAK